MEKDNVLVFFALAVFLFSCFSINSTYGELRSYVTGRATFEDTGRINVTIENVTFYNFTWAEINWGPGFVHASEEYATLDTLGNVGNGTWSSVDRGFEIVNLGNTNLTVNLSSGKAASSFIGGTSPSYQYNVSNLNDSACDPGAGFNLGQFYDVSASPTSQEICDSFHVNQMIRIDLKLQVPSDSIKGNLTDSFVLAVSQSFS